MAALAVWIYYLTSPSDVLGILALVVWWIEVVVGILILARWLPGTGRHAAPAVDDSWAEGPYLSILGHASHPTLDGGQTCEVEHCMTTMSDGLAL